MSESPKIKQSRAQPVRASEAIVETLEEEIMSGRHTHGAPLPAERDLMERFCASRTVIREAVAQLASRGFLETRPRFRPIVRKPGYDTAIESVSRLVGMMIKDGEGVKPLFDSRVFVERALVREAALTADKVDIAALRDALAANEAAIPNSEAFFHSDVAFHAVLYRVPRNPIFPTLQRAYVSWLFPHWLDMHGEAARNALNFASHQRIFDAILERDPDAAEAAMVAHMEDAWEQVRGSLAR